MNADTDTNLREAHPEVESEDPENWAVYDADVVPDVDPLGMEGGISLFMGECDAGKLERLVYSVRKFH